MFFLQLTSVIQDLVAYQTSFLLEYIIISEKTRIKNHTLMQKSLRSYQNTLIRKQKLLYYISKIFFICVCYIKNGQYFLGN